MSWRPPAPASPRSRSRPRGSACKGVRRRNASTSATSSRKSRTNLSPRRTRASPGSGSVAPLGWYTPDSVQSLPCAAGSFTDVLYATECQESPAGRSQPASGQSDCVTCLTSTHQPLPGQLECAPCAAGRFSADDYAIGCDECPAGRSQPASGQGECIECVPGTYQPEAGRLGCELCSSFQLGRDSRAGATACDFCGDGLYLADDASATDGKNCFACPAHADCATGTTLETLNVHPGYWRTGPISPKLKRCFLESACVGGNASQCAPGYHKTLCASCEHNYYREVSTGKCHKCDAAATRRTRHFFGLHLFLLLLFCASPFVVARFLGATRSARRRMRRRSRSTARPGRRGRGLRIRSAPRPCGRASRRPTPPSRRRTSGACGRRPRSRVTRGLETSCLPKLR